MTALTGVAGPIAALWLLVMLVCLVMFPAIILGATVVWAALRRHPDRALCWALAAALAPVAWMVWTHGPDYSEHWHQLVKDLQLGRTPSGDDLRTVLAWGAGVGPALGTLWWRTEQIWRERQPMAGPWERRRRQQHEAARRRAIVHLVQGAAHAGHVGGRHVPRPLQLVAGAWAVPLAGNEGPVLGRLLDGDLDWPRVRRHLLVLPLRTVHHVVLLGASGAGKSELAWRLVEYDIRAGDRQVIYLNCKQPGPGDEPSLRLAALAEEAGSTFRALVRDGAPWDPMRGTPDQVRQRLTSTQVWSEEYYEHASNVLLGLALDLAASEGRSLATLPELVWSLARDRLAKLAETNAEAAELVQMLGRREVAGAVMRWASQSLQLRGWIGPADADGWGWEDADIIGADLPTSTEPGAARALLRAMLTDLEGWITDGSRRPRRGTRFRPLTLVIEEVSALDADPLLGRRLVNLVERARSVGVRVIVVAQGPSGLGDERAQEAMMTNCAVITCRQTDQEAVERLAGLAGTEQHEEASAAYGGSMIGTGAGLAGSMRVQEQYRVSPNGLRQLGMGEAIVMHQGRWAWLAVAMTESSYHEPSGQQADQLRAQLEHARIVTPVAPTADDPRDNDPRPADPDGSHSPW